MKIVDRALALVGLERRADTFDRYWGNFEALRSGTAVTPESAQSLSACYAAVSVISEAVGSLALHLYRRGDEGRTRAVDHPLYAVLHHNPNPMQTAVEYREWMTASMLAHGNAYSRIIRGADGQVRELHPLPAERVVVLRKGDVIGGYEYTDRDGKKERLLPSEVFHLRHRAGNDPLIGVSPIQAARSAFESALAEAAYGKETFAGGTRVSGVLKFPGKLNAEQMRSVAESWRTHKSGGTAVLDNGADFLPVSMSLKDAEFVLVRRFSVEEIARIFKLPPILLGDPTAANYANSVEMFRWFTTHSLQRHLTNWQQAIAKQLLTPAAARTLYPEFAVESMLRGSPKERSEFYKTAVDAGWLSVDEIRAMENLPKLERKYQPQQPPKGAGQ